MSLLKVIHNNNRFRRASSTLSCLHRNISYIRLRVLWSNVVSFHFTLRQDYDIKVNFNYFIAWLFNKNICILYLHDYVSFSCGLLCFLYVSLSDDNLHWSHKTGTRILNNIRSSITLLLLKIPSLRKWNALFNSFVSFVEFSYLIPSLTMKRKLKNKFASK